ncbi:MAG: hypothetical protein HYY97_16390, partial [Rhodocyclales bacterium]|nr:hypothetical protein [Rhodocyclales bacterium]
WTSTGCCTGVTLSGILNNQAGGLFELNLGSFGGGMSGAGTVNNAGELRKSLNGTAVTTPIAPAFNNLATGVVDVTSGSLSFSGNLGNAGTIAVASGASLQKSGGFSNASGATISGAGTIDVGAGNALSNDGTIAPGVGVGGTAVLAITGNLVLGGTSIIEADIGGTTAGSLYDQIALSGNLSLGGDIRYQAVGGFTGGTGNSFALLSPSGTTSGTSTVTTLAANPAFVFGPTTASGTLTIAGLMNFWTLAGDGNWNAGSNWSRGVKPDSTMAAVIDQAGGAYTVTVNTAEAAKSVKLAGDEILSITAGSLDLALASDIGTAATMNLSGGSLTGAGNLMINGSMNWSGGTQGTNTGTTTIAAGANLDITGPVNLSRRIDNYGTTTWSGTGNIFTTGGGASVVFDNKAGGQFLIQNDQSIQGDGGSVEVVVNSGLLRKTIAVGATLLTSAVDFNNADGTLDIQSGTLNFGNAFNPSGAGTLTAGTLTVGGGGNGSGNFSTSAGTTVNFSGGSFNLAVGASIASSGLLAIGGGTLANSGTITTANLNLSSGTLNGEGGVTVNGSMNWSGGTQSTNTGTTTIAAGASLDITGPVNLSRRIDNYGTTTWSGTGNIFTTGGGASVVFDNKAGGQFLIQNDQSIQGDGGSVEVVVNSGLLRKTVAVGATLLTSAVEFTNNAGGVTSIESGSLRVDSFTGGVNSGVLEVAAGATLSTNGSSLINATSGIIRGGGTLDLAAATLTNDGILAPGVGAGDTATLSLTGNLDLAGGSVAIDVGGTAPGLADKLAVTGNVTMAAALSASLVGGYTPLNGDFIPYLTMTGTASGSFATTSLPANFDAGYNLAPGEASRLIHSTAGTKTFLNTASDLNWATPTNWSGGALPGAGNTALISSGFAVAHPSGDDTIAALIVDSGNSLDVSGGSLTVGGTATVGGSLAVSGGTLVLNGASSVQNLGISGGALNGSGNLTVANGFDYSGGTVGLSGALDVTHIGNLSLPAMESLTSLQVNATGNVALTGGITAGGTGDAILIAAGQDFINAGNHPLSAGNGRWLVYSQDPATIVKGGLISDFRRYGNSPGSVAATGNGFVYASAAGTLLVDVVATGTASHEYGNAPSAGFAYALTGFSDAEDNAGNVGIDGLPAYSVPLPTAASDAGNYGIAYVGGLSSGVGYSFSGGAGLAYSVTQAPLTVTASDQSKVYGDTLSFTGTEFVAVGLKNGQTVDGVTLASSGAASLAGVAGSPYAITASAAAGGSFNPANYSVTYVDGALTVTPRPLTLSFAAQTKTYDGNASASLGSYVLNNLANGDMPGLVATAAYDSRDVGATKTVSYSGLALSGGKTADYSLPAAASGSGSITPLPSVTWTGGAGGNWSTASNWAGGALPDGVNVLAVSIPAGTVVSFDAATAATQLDSLMVGSGGGFVMAGGSLGIAGSLTTPTFNQTGGTLNGAGSLTVSQSFAKNGGSLALGGPVNLTQAAGALTLNYDAPLTLGAVSTVSGNILIDASGGIVTTASPVTANGGSLAFTAHSPIHIGSGGLTATADLSLSAPTASADSTITLDGPLAAGGAVNVSAYGAIAQNAGIQGQTIALASSNGSIVIDGGAVSSVPAGGSISYSAPTGSITSSPANFAGATPSLAGSGGTTTSTTTNTTTNDIITAVTQTADALTDDPVTTTAPPATAETFAGPAVLSAVAQTTGGDAGTFGASPEPEVGAGDTAAKPPSTAETSGSGQAPETSEADKRADDEKDEKRTGKAQKQEDRKKERSAATKKLAQCS